MRPDRRIFPTLLAAALTVAACGTPTARPALGGRPWVVATTSDLAGVNELVSGGVRFTHEIQRLLYLELLEEQPDYARHPPSFAPSLAASWETSPDHLTLTFHLRPDARWSDGAPVTARDVLFTYRAQRDPAIAWSYADSKDSVAEITAPDEHTVRFRFRIPYAFGLVDVNDGQIFPEHAWGELPFADWRRSGDWFRHHLVVSGPYTIASWQPGAELVLERNPDSIAADPGGPERVTFRVVPDPAAEIEQLLAGELDFVDNLAPLDAQRVKADPKLKLLTSDSRQFDYIGWNERRPPFDDPEIRRALTLGIDRQALVDTLWKGYARVAAGPVPANAWARDPELAPWPYDPDAARSILARKGFADRDGDGILERHGRPFRFELVTNSSNRIRSDALVLIQAQLRRIGVDVVPRTMELQTLTERNRAGDYDATLAGWAIDTTLDFRPYFDSGERGPTGWNFIDYANPEVDRLFDEIRAQPDLERSKPLFVRLQRILHDQQPYTFLWEQRRLAAVRADVEGAEITPLAALASLPHWRRRPHG